MRNLLITGGAGFIGANFAIYIAKKYGYKIHIVDAMTYAGDKRNLEEIEDDYEFYKVDICDKTTMRELIMDNHIDSIVHFAAESHVDRSFHRDNPFVMTNVVGTNVLLDIAREVYAETGIFRFHHISTDEVYGDKAISSYEGDVLNPTSLYAASKAASDILAMSYYRSYGMDIVISNCSNNYGPCQHKEKFIPAVISKMMTGGVVLLHGNGEHTRDWLHVSDHCSAIDKIFHFGTPGKSYNISSYENYTNKQVALDIAKYLDIDGADRLIRFTKDRLVNDKGYYLSSERLRNLGWLPEIKFKDGLRQTVAWYMKNTERL